MPHSSQKDLLDLPQTADSWFFAIRQLHTWLLSKSKEPVRPFLMIAINRSTEIIQGSSLVEKSDNQGARKVLFSAMTHPPKELGAKPQRPARVIFEDRNLLQALAPALKKIGVQATCYPHNDLLEALLKDLEANLNDNQPDIPGLLSGNKITPQVVGGLFNAAAKFYRAAPWIQLSDDDFLAVRVLPQKDPYYLSVMGQAGIEYGLALYLHWADVESLYPPQDGPMEVLPAEGAHSFLFNEITEISFDDLDAIEKYGWPVANNQAYPFPAIFGPGDQVRRPDRDQILWYEAVLGAVPEFVQKHMKKNTDGELQPIDARVQVSTSTGQKTVEITFPAGDLPLVEHLADDPYEEDLETGDTPIPFDRRAIEGEMARRFESLADNDCDPNLKKAQELMYKAWEEQNPAKRLALAHKALKESEDCADAYVLLAEEEADSLKHSFEFFQKGVEAGERALGEDYFEVYTGHFWGLMETRPYMRALEGKASCLWQLKRKDEALDTYYEMLYLNPNDNQGVRFVLVDLLLSLNREVELDDLVRQYKGDPTAVWLYTEALLSFRKKGASTTANRKLTKAFEENQHVADYLIGKKRIPGQLPTSLSFGGESEAVDYAANHLNYWRSTPGAIEWFQRQLTKAASPSKAPTGKSIKQSSG
jgi:tetratricopeptide (TPR) repeat protein